MNMKVNQSSIFRGIFLAAVIFIGARAEYNNRYLDKRLDILEEGASYSHTIQTDTAMKFETFLQALSNELPTEVQAYAAETAERVARETTVSTLKQFSENLKKIDVQLDK
jgi:hypothetical protein